MAGSPKKRARKKARELVEAGDGTGALPQPDEPGPARLEAAASVAESDPRDASPLAPLPAPIEGEILPPESAEPSRTALKRAMRRRAQEYADKAIEILAAAMESPDERIRVNAANDILDRAYGKPTPEIDAGDGGLSVVILRFGDQA